jgi:hypothetical protein
VAFFMLGSFSGSLLQIVLQVCRLNQGDVTWHSVRKHEMRVTFSPERLKCNVDLSDLGIDA